MLNSTTGVVYGVLFPVIILSALAEEMTCDWVRLRGSTDGSRVSPYGVGPLSWGNIGQRGDSK